MRQTNLRGLICTNGEEHQRTYSGVSGELALYHHFDFVLQQGFAHVSAAKIRQYCARHEDYALRKWEKNLHFVDNLTDAYDNFTEPLLTADRDFVEIGREMDWQTQSTRPPKSNSKPASAAPEPLPSR